MDPYPGGRPSSPGWLLITLAILTLAFPASLLSASPTDVPDRDGTTVPPLPAVAGPALSVADQLDHLPIASRALTEDWLHATIIEPATAALAFEAAWDRLDVPAAAAADLERLRRRIALEPLPAHAPELEPDDWATVVELALEPLVGDPSNLVALNDAAVALFLLGATGEVLDGPPPLRGLPADAPWEPEYAAPSAIRLLQAIDATFPPDRAIRLNLGFMRSVVPDPTVPWTSAIEPVAAVLDDDPGDLTARVLLASLESRRADVPGGAVRSEAILAEALEATATTSAVPVAVTALLTAAIGDGHLAEAAIRAAEAPHASVDHARQALDAYDAALERAADPGIYAGRAAALVMLDALDDAVASQEQAIALAPDAVQLRIGLARIHEARGDLDAMRSAIDAAVSRLPGPTWPPAMRDARFPTGPYGFRVLGDRGFMGWSFGSEREPRPVQVTPQGAGIVVIDLAPPRITPVAAHARDTDLAPYVAFDLGMVARVAQGDVDGTVALAEAWTARVPLGADWDRSIEAARLVAAGGVPAELAGSDALPGILARAEASLRAVERDEAAGRLCAAIADDPGQAALRRQAEQCAGASALRASRWSSAATYLRRAADTTDPAADPVAPLVRLMAAAAVEESGALDEAARRYRAAALDPGAGDDAATVRSLALVRLGDLALSRGDPIAAAEDYALASAALELDPPSLVSYWQDASSVMGARAVEQVLRNNRAVARLQLLQPEPEVAPSCAGTDRALCEAALADIRAAIASDPGRGAYHLNEGWVTRLLGDDEAATAALTRAVALDPSLFPASNDLGIAMARAGDIEGARQAFLDALAAEPGYALARWNLGVLESRAGGSGVIGGQASLAEAVRLDPSLRDAPLEFRFDERTYRFSFEPGAPAPGGAPIGRSYTVAAVLFGGAATAVALVQLQASVTSDALARLSEAGHRRIERLGRRARIAARRRGWRRRLGPAAAALPWLVSGSILVVLTAAHALGTSPDAAGAGMLLAVLAVASAVAVHALGHLVAARMMPARILPAQWLPGAAMALLLAPLQVASGPFLAERARVTASDPRATAWLHAAGPAANALFAVLVYAAWLVTPVPALRLIVLMQLAAIGYALLPVRPLDGAVIARSHPTALLLVGVALTAAATAFALGLL